MKITIQADFGRIILQMEGSSWDLYSPYVFVFPLWLFDIVKHVIKEPKTCTKKSKIETMDVRLNDEFFWHVHSRHFSKRSLFSLNHYSLYDLLLRCQMQLH